jgi:CheY-like chemotaxis protein
MMTPKRALVVDDSRSARYSLRKTLERLDISVDCVESGETALSYLETARTELPDIIFMDNLMPGLSGFDTTTTICHDDRWRHIPVIMCTATQNSDPTQQPKTAAGYLPKPATLNQIQALLANLSAEPTTILNSTIQGSKKQASTTDANSPTATVNIVAPEDETSATGIKLPTQKAESAPVTPSLIQGQGRMAARKETPTEYHTQPHNNEKTNIPNSNQPTSNTDNAKEITPKQINTGTHAPTADRHNDFISTAPNQATQTAQPTQLVQPKQFTQPIAAEQSLDALIDQLQGQLNGIEPRLLSLESAKHTLDTAIHQRLKDMHDQLVAHVHQLIEEAIQKHENPSLDWHTITGHITEQVTGAIDQAFSDKLTPIETQLREEIDAQSRHIEHRLMGEVVNTDHVIEQASAAAAHAADQQLKNYLQSQATLTEGQITGLLNDMKQSILAETTQAASKKAGQVASQAAEKIACQQAEKAVSDNVNRLQRQLVQSAQSQINDALKKQQILSLAGFGVAILALALSVIL